MGRSQCSGVFADTLLGEPLPLQGCSALHMSASLDTALLSQLLIQAGADVDWYTSSILLLLFVCASFRVRSLVFSLSLSLSLCVCVSPSHPLLHIPSSSHVVVVVLPLRVPSTNSSTPEGETPLHCAALAGSLSNTKLLLLSGARVDARNGDGCTPLMWSLIGNHTPVFQALLEFGANPMICDHRSMSPLHVAARGHQLECLELGLQGSFLKSKKAPFLPFMPPCWVSLIEGS